MFACSKCGVCCRSLNFNSIYQELHDGNGVCKFLDLADNTCKIYEERPLLCNISESYKTFFSELYTKEEFYNLNYNGCFELNSQGEKYEKE